MICHGDDLHIVRVGYQVHGSAHALEWFPGDHVVCHIAFGADLQGAEERDIDVSTSDHAEGFGAVKGCGAGDESDGFFSGVYDVSGWFGENVY